jgi:co-chaperonin GroES (HSP10)
MLSSVSLLLILCDGATSFSSAGFQSSAFSNKKLYHVKLIAPKPAALVTINSRSIISRMSSWDNDDYMDALSNLGKRPLEEKAAMLGNIDDPRMMTDPRMEQDPGNKNEKSRMFQRMLQAKQEGVPGMPPMPRNLSVQQQQEQQQQQKQQQQPLPVTPKPYYPLPPPADPSSNPYAASGFPPPPYGYNPYYPPPPSMMPPRQDLSPEQQQQYMMWMMQQQQMQQQQYPPAYYSPPPMAEGVSQVPPPAGYYPPPFGYPGYYPPTPPQVAAQQQQPTQQAELPFGAPALPPLSELIGTNTGPIRTPRAVAEVDPTDPDKPVHTKKRQPDKIANTSDLYLETLKLDTATRQRARLRGDLDEANAIFKDPRINQIKEQLKPYLDSSARLAGKETSQLDTATAEEILFAQQQRLLREQQENDPSNTGISYRELLKRRLSNKEEPKKQESTTAATMFAPTEKEQQQHQQITTAVSNTERQREEQGEYNDQNYFSAWKQQEDNEECQDLLMIKKDDCIEIIDSSLSCVEGVIAAYKKAPSPSMLASVHNALLQAAQTCSTATQ